MEPNTREKIPLSEETAYLEFELDLPLPEAQILSQALDNDAIPELSGYFEVLYDEEREIKDRTRLLLYFSPGKGHPGIEIEILLASLQINDCRITDRTVDRDQYQEAYKEHYKSFPVSRRFVIVPSWEKGTEKERVHMTDESIALYLDPGLAFGTGLHPTTRLCLSYLDDKMKSGARVIDGGCGSGVLSIGALLLGASKVLGFDVDNNAARSSDHNLSLNHKVSGEFIVKCGGFDLPEFQEMEADLFIGNLTWNIIRANSERIHQGHFPSMILSGILVDRADEVIEHFSPVWNFVEKRELEGWIMLEFLRRSDHQ